jgi:hypothetical protein
LWPGFPPRSRSACGGGRWSGRDVSRIAAGGGGTGLGVSRTIGAGGRSCGIDSRRGSRGAGAGCGISRIGPEADGICIAPGGGGTGLGASRTIGAGGRSCGIDSRRGSRGAGAGCGISRIGPEADGICIDLPVSRTMGIAGRS